MFGTASTQAAALYSCLGRERARAFFTSLNNRSVRVVDGNSVVRDLVADGQLAYGITDADDAGRAIESGRNVAIIIPDQGPGEKDADGRIPSSSQADIRICPGLPMVKSCRGRQGTPAVSMGTAVLLKPGCRAGPLYQQDPAALKYLQPVHDIPDNALFRSMEPGRI
jgi:hypothetical protein